MVPYSILRRTVHTSVLFSQGYVVFPQAVKRDKLHCQLLVPNLSLKQLLCYACKYV